jgi:hypothetical protein
VRGYRRSIVQSDLNRRPNALGILDDFVGPKSDDSPSLSFHGGRATSIRFDLKGVMLAVDLDDELPRYAGKVGEIRPDRMLATEFYAVDPPVTD